MSKAKQQEKQQKQDKRGEILDAAERRARSSGYNGFSFRDLADDVGIKSASVHYHFPTKEALGTAITERYTARSVESLGDAQGLSEAEAFDRVAGLFLHSHEVDDLMCLCGMFGAEAAGLPDALVVEVRAYFDALIDWLSAAFKGQGRTVRAELVVASLEGALIMSRVRKDKDQLRRLQSEIRKTLA